MRSSMAARRSSASPSRSRSRACRRRRMWRVCRGQQQQGACTELRALVHPCAPTCQPHRAVTTVQVRKGVRKPAAARWRAWGPSRPPSPPIPAPSATPNPPQPPPPPPHLLELRQPPALLLQLHRARTRGRVVQCRGLQRGRQLGASCLGLRALGGQLGALGLWLRGRTGGGGRRGGGARTGINVCGRWVVARRRGAM